MPPLNCLLNTLAEPNAEHDMARDAVRAEVVHDMLPALKKGRLGNTLKPIGTVALEAKLSPLRTRFVHLSPIFSPYFITISARKTHKIRLADALREVHDYPLSTGFFTPPASPFATCPARFGGQRRRNRAGLARHRHRYSTVRRAARIGAGAARCAETAAVRRGGGTPGAETVAVCAVAARPG
jgi:hypothetical protein